MSTTKSTHAVSAYYPSSVPKDYSELLGKPPLLANEEPRRYSLLFGQYVSIVGPSDVVEWLWLKEAVDLRWEIIRLGGFTPEIIQGERPFIFGRLLIGAGIHKSQLDYYLDCYDEGGEAKEIADAVLDSRGWTSDTVFALAFAESIQKHESIDKMIAGKSRRHDQLLHVIRQRQMTRDQSDASRDKEVASNAAPLVPTGGGA